MKKRPLNGCQSSQCCSALWVNVQRLSWSPLVLQLLVVLADEVAADARLEVGEDRRQPVVTPLLELTEDAGLEEDLGVTETILVAEVQRRQHLLRRHFAVDEARRNHIRSQDRIATGKLHAFNRHPPASHYTPHLHKYKPLSITSSLFPSLPAQDLPTSFTNLSQRRLPLSLRSDSIFFHGLYYWTVSSEHFVFCF